MTVSISSRYVKYSPTVATTQFAIPFPIFGIYDVAVRIAGVEETNFSVGGTFSAGRSDNAHIDLLVSVSHVDVEILGARQARRDTNFATNSPKFGDNMQADADKLTASLQEVQRDLKRSIKLSWSETELDLAFPDAAARANKFMVFDNAGSPDLANSVTRNPILSGWPPSNPTAGMFYQNTSNGSLYVRNETNDKWVQIALQDTEFFLSRIGLNTYNVPSVYKLLTYGQYPGIGIQSNQPVGGDGGGYIDFLDIDFNVQGNIYFDQSMGSLSFGTAPPGVQHVTAMFINSSGRVGIGTTAPSYNLEVVGAVGSANYGSGASFTLRSANGTLAAPTQITAASLLANLDFRGYDNASAFRSVANIRAYSDGAITSTSSPGFLSFLTTPSGSIVNVEAMRILSSGALILTGSTAQKATGTTWSNPSDQRLKDNIRDYPKGIDELMQVRVRQWEYNGKGGTTAGMKGLGVIADEAMLVLPETVKTYDAKLEADDAEVTAIKEFDATEITWLLVKAVQEQKRQIDQLKAQIEALENAM